MFYIQLFNSLRLSALAVKSSFRSGFKIAIAGSRNVGHVNGACFSGAGIAAGCPALVTEWPVFKFPNFKIIRKLMKIRLFLMAVTYTT